MLTSIEEFAIEFVKRARNQHLLLSTRQAITITQLGTSRRIRKRRITVSDLVEIAKITTPPPHQELAEKIARNILSGKSLQRIETNKELQDELDKFKKKKASKLEKSQKEKIVFQSDTSNDIFAKLKINPETITMEDFEEGIKEKVDSLGAVKTLEELGKIDMLENTDFTSYFRELEAEKLEKASIEELLEHAIENETWIELLKKKVEGIRQQNKETIERILEKLLQTTQNFLDEEIKFELKEDVISKLFKELVDKAENYEELKQIKEDFRDMETNIEQILMEKGKELGLNEIELSNLSMDSYSILQTMIKFDVDDFREFSTILSKSSLNIMQIDNIIKSAISKKMASATAALMEKHFLQTTRELAKHENGEELFRNALGMAHGENLLRNYYKVGDSIPSPLKEILKEYAKQILIETAKVRKHEYGLGMGFGNLLGVLRPYTLGDEFEQIDIENSLDHLLLLGKTPDNFELEELLVRDYEKGKRDIIILIDKSGSMTGQSIATAALSTMILTYALEKDNLGVAFFDSNTSVACNLTDREKDMQLLLETILGLKAQGGTMIGRALDWANDQFNKSKSKEQGLFVVTDSQIADIDHKLDLLQKLVERNVKVTFLMTKEQVNKTVLTKIGITTVFMNSWDELVPKLASILENR